VGRRPTCPNLPSRVTASRQQSCSGFWTVSSFCKTRYFSPTEASVGGSCHITLDDSLISCGISINPAGTAAQSPLARVYEDLSGACR
jgi:hypothetical protein